MPPKRPNDDDKAQTPRRPSPYRPGAVSSQSKVTPRIARQAHRVNARGQRVKKLGEVLMYDLRGIVENSLSYFKKNVLPEIPNVDLFSQSKLLAETLKKGGVYIIDGRWVGFASNPADVKQHEDKVFVKLKDIWDAVLEKSKDLAVLKPLASSILVKLTAKPRNHGKGLQSSRAKPDLLFEVIKSRVVVSASEKLDVRRYLFGNIVAFVEAKKYLTTGSQYQNIKQVVINANFLLCEDPTRRAVICFSVENTDMRIWVFTRAGAMVSQAFNFITDHETLIYVFLSLAYASEEAVGYNPKMVMIRSPVENEQNAIQYLIYFRDRVLRTTGAPLSDYKADFFMGRCTRVVRAQGIHPPTPVFALRTSWLPLGSKMEHERIADVNAAIKALAPNQRFDLKRYWLTVVLAGINKFIRAGKLVEDDDTTDLFARERFDATQFYPGYTEIKELLPLKTLSGSGRSRSTGHIHEETKSGNDSGLPDSTYTGDAKSFQLIHNAPRVHYYIGYKEICEPLHSVSPEKLQLHEVFYALADAVYGLWALHKAGYVHRDVSTGNILYYRVGEQVLVKIADLEYMRKMTDTSASEDVKTGTLQFTSVELQTQCYQFWTEEESIAEHKPGDYKLNVALHQQKEFDNLEPVRSGASESRRKNKSVQPRYNALHDLESLFWIGMWFLCYHCPAFLQESWEGQAGNKQLDMAFTVFVEHYNMQKPPSNRLSCLMTDAGILKVLDTVPVSREQESPNAFDHAVVTMKIIRQHLERFYREIESRPEFPNPYTSVLPDYAYEVIEDVFKRLARRLCPLKMDIVRTRYKALAKPSSNVVPHRAPKKTPIRQPAVATNPVNEAVQKSDSQISETIVNRLRNTSISDNPNDSESDSSYDHIIDEELNPDVNLDSWIFANDPSDNYYNSDYSVLTDDDLASTDTAIGVSRQSRTRRADSDSDPFLV